MAQSKITSFFGGGKKPAIKEENNLKAVEIKHDPEDDKNKIGSTSPKRKADPASLTMSEPPSKKIKTESKARGILTSDPNFPDREPVYGPVLDAWWPEGSSVPYIHLSRTYQELEKHTKRTTILQLLTLMFMPVLKYSPDDFLSVFYLCVHKVAPVWEGVELGVGDSILFSAIAEVTGRSTAELRKDFVALGDIGDVAQKSRSHQKTVFMPKPLSVPQVFAAMKEIAFMKGNSSQKQKKDKMKGLLSSCREDEAKFIFRTLSGKLRVRMLERTLSAALANALYYTQNDTAYQQFRAIVSQGKAEDLMEVIEIDDDEDLILKPKKVNKKANNKTSLAKESEELKEKLRWAQEILRVVFNEMPCYDEIIPLLLEKKLTELEGKSFLKPGFPLRPMLANRADGIAEVQQRFGTNEFILEYKYDGERAQIHRTADGTIKIFSRACEDHTKKFPDVLLMLPEILLAPDTTFILDCEIVAIKEDDLSVTSPDESPVIKEEKNSSKTFKILPFQLLSTRARKEVKLEDIKVRVAMFAFDVLYLNGESLIKLPLIQRRQKLLDAFKIVPGKFQLVESISSKDSTVEEMSKFLKKAIDDNCEGLMCKILDTSDSDYQLSKRSNSWLKVKKDFAGMVDSLDLVVIGGYYGRGKRVGVYGSYLLAVYDSDNDTFQAITKCMTGFTDEFLSSTAQFFENHKLTAPPTYYLYSPSQAPDVWFEPVQVWEIQYADFSISPVHKAAIGLVEEDKGISVRFPRYIRSRDDKTPENATTADEIAEMYHRQNSKVVNSMGSNNNRIAVDLEN